MKYDLVVSYVDSTKEKWQKEYTKYMNEEIKEGKQKATNRQAFGIERTRDWETLKYYLRCVEKNCKWVRNVIVIMQDEDQLPDWLDTNNDKLRVIYHRDYIPKELLPTFNSVEIGMYISRIKDLSDLYVISDDDFYFINEVSEDLFFRNGKTLQTDKRHPYCLYDERYTTASDGVFYQILNNNLMFEKKYMNGEKIKYAMTHMPTSRDKKVEQQILNENEELFMERFKNSRFRHGSQISAETFPNILKLKKLCEFDNNLTSNCMYVTLKSDVDFDSYKDYKIVCFNDTEQLDDFETTKKKLHNFFEKLFPNKSSFEK